MAKTAVADRQGGSNRSTITMTRWLSLAELDKKYTGITARLSDVLRAFCYTFILGLVLKGPGTIHVGIFEFGSRFLKICYVPVLGFILIDLAQYVFHSIVIVVLRRANESYRKYKGSGGEHYEEKLDDSEILIPMGKTADFWLNQCVSFIFLIKVLIGLSLVALLLFKLISTLLQ